MGLFARVVAAKPASGGSYAKPGRYWIILENVKLDRHAMKNVEFVAFETRVIKVLDNPTGSDGKHLGPTEGEPCSFVFLDGQLGADARLKSWVMVSVSCAEGDITEEAMAELTNPKLQPIKDVVLEVFSAPQVTRSKKDIIASRPVRRVSAKEVSEQCSAAIKADVLGNGRLERMLAVEASESAAKK